jgi:hypothetical protein
VCFGPSFLSFPCNGPSVPARILRRARLGVIDGGGAGLLLHLVEDAVEVLHVEDEAGAEPQRGQVRPDGALEGPAPHAEVLHRFGAVQAALHGASPAWASSDASAGVSGPRGWATM